MSFNGIPFFSMNKVISGPFSITGGVTSSYVDGSTTYMVHTFTTSDTMDVIGSGTIDYLLIGGGGGGSNGGNFGGGGGSGQQKYETNFTINEGTYTITIGAGGAAQTFGSTSSVDFDSSIGGFRGVSLGYNSATWSGVSPQESRWFISGTGSNTTGGGLGVGGGGGGGANQDGMNSLGNTNPSGQGGYGLTNSITGTAVIRGGGGGGAGVSVYANGGAGGGGQGGWNSSGQRFGRPGTVNTGSGGGGAVNDVGGAGGSGIFILRYAL